MIYNSFYHSNSIFLNKINYSLLQTYLNKRLEFNYDKLKSETNLPEIENKLTKNKINNLSGIFKRIYSILSQKHISFENIIKDEVFVVNMNSNEIGIKVVSPNNFFKVLLQNLDNQLSKNEILLIRKNLITNLFGIEVIEYNDFYLAYYNVISEGSKSINELELSLLTKNTTISELFFIIQNHISIVDGKRMIHYKTFERLLYKMNLYVNENNTFYDVIVNLLNPNEMIDVESMVENTIRKNKILILIKL